MICLHYSYLSTLQLLVITATCLHYSYLSLQLLVYITATCYQWTTLPNQFSFGGVLYPQFKTNSSCLAACAAVLSGCVAVDISSDGVECWAHFNASDTSRRYSWNTVNQFVMNQTACPYIGTQTHDNHSVHIFSNNGVC